jgi:F-box domain
MEKSPLYQLPEEVLLNVLSFVDYSSRADVALVCKEFYNLLCDLEKDQFALELSWKQVNENKILKNFKTLSQFSILCRLQMKPLTSRSSTQKESSES